MTTTAELTTYDEQSIYVACLAAYNSGTLHGEWITLTDDIEETWNRIRKMLAASPIPDAEEWAIHDFEGFAGVRLSEWEDIERVHELSEFLQSHDEVGALVLDHYNGDIEDANRALENYMGCYQSIADYAQEITESRTEIPKHLEFYIDYERMGRDMDLSGDILTLSPRYDEVHIFLNH
ncbi:MAG: antirestriction protein ArdA [Verrucomicrobiota bacterium]